MKVTIEKIPPGSEPEIIVRSNELDDSLMQFIYSINSPPKKLIGIADLRMHILEPKDVYYFESVDNKVFIYSKDKLYESKLKLYEIEEEYDNSGFFRASKSIILNIAKIESVKAVFYGRFEALLQNGEKVLISRQYVPVFKKRLGL
jgi:DNA-binding LytR/AlgR family response regulator